MDPKKLNCCSYNKQNFVFDRLLKDILPVRVSNSCKKIPISARPYPSYLGHSQNFTFSGFSDSWPDNVSRNKGNDIYSLSNFRRCLWKCSGTIRLT